MGDEQTPALPDEGVPLREVVLLLCDMCLRGEGGECHSPGCSLWMNRAPDIAVTPLAGRTVLEPEPDWSALNDACNDYTIAYMHEDDSLLPAALDKVRRSLAGEDPYNPGLASESSGDGSDA